MIGDDLERLRLSHAERSISLPDQAEGIDRFIGRVTTSGAGLALNKFVSVIPQTLLGTEGEGSTPVWYDAGSTPIPVLLLGPGVPVTGDRLLVRSVGHRWVARRKSAGGGGGGTGSFLGCTCTTAPGTLHMTVTPSGCGGGLIQDCTLVYGPTPPELTPLGLGASCYLSTTSFPDGQTGDLFYYYLSCFSTIFRISRVFPESIYGSPFLGPVIYHWMTGLPGNTCHPFLLSNGEILLGGDPSCVVVISE